MEQGTITKAALRDFLASLTGAFRVYGPRSESGSVDLVEMDQDSALSFEYRLTPRSAKGLIFPQTELLATYEAGGTFTASSEPAAVLVFGARPCDARALAILDAVFTKDIQDPYYGRRRQRSLVIALACQSSDPSCFCTVVGGGPAGSEGADILAVESGESLVLKAVTDKGATFMEQHAERFTKVDAGTVPQESAEPVGDRELPGAIDAGKLCATLEGAFDTPFWASATKACLGCGSCTFLCPTCHCFTICDEDVGETGERTRCWDSCQYPTFTREASGHNPRGTSRERMRQRVMHKFSYFVRNFGRQACVGCGRCVANCPVNLDIREVIRELNA